MRGRELPKAGQAHSAWSGLDELVSGCQFSLHLRVLCTLSCFVLNSLGELINSLLLEVSVYPGKDNLFFFFPL